ncbi:hypothetical protein CALCODRAFT_500213 [Calocera cornea HHB12733]|uniref:WD40 repeat-like protein n=1 Tax=Calocera cornea HHB12733 TaxID=1353952 RepID=A0A165E654_9BASI|nr:hypothetical protein CALCODRAFT_500213 [Calocera cornea HHB12733]
MRIQVSRFLQRVSIIARTANTVHGNHPADLGTSWRFHECGPKDSLLVWMSKRSGRRRYSFRQLLYRPDKSCGWNDRCDPPSREPGNRRDTSPLLAGYMAVAHCRAVSENSKHVAGGCDDGTSRIYEINVEEPKPFAEHALSPQAVVPLKQPKCWYTFDPTHRVPQGRRNRPPSVDRDDMGCGTTVVREA